MNLFVLSLDPEEAARFHNDKHCNKMILEGFQCLSTCHRWIDGCFAPAECYKSTHVNHPVNLWLRESSDNYDWAYALVKALSNEFTYRYGKEHLSYTKLGDSLATAPTDLPSYGMTPFALAMPDYCKTEDAVESYRNYYREEKWHLGKWTKRPVPDFMYS